MSQFLSLIRRFPPGLLLLLLLLLLPLLPLLAGCTTSEPEAPRAAKYVGSAACAECHKDAYEAWKTSVHARAEETIATALARPEFASAVTSGPADAVHHPLICSEGRAQIAMATTTGSVEMFDTPRVLGYTPLVQFLVPKEGGRYQVTTTAFDPEKKDWFDVFGADRRNPEDWSFWQNRGMNWNSMCATCHNTGFRKNYDRKADIYKSAMAEMGVGCEACHGPGEAHINWRRAGGTHETDPLRRAAGVKLVDMCGTCHARRVELNDNQFLPGDSFLDHYVPELPDFTENFYPDGQVREEDYEYSSFRMSKMHQMGVRCVDCHQAHSAKPRLPGNDLCLRCHGGTIDPAKHSRHDPALPGGKCTDCHMPTTVYMQRQARHDHGFTIPDPELTKEFGVPNACNRCHTDQSADWASKALAEWGYDPAKRSTGVRARVIAKARRHDRSAVQGLLEILTADPSPAWRAIAAGLLEPWTELPEVREKMVARLKDPDPIVRNVVVSALDRVQSLISGALEPSLKDPSRAVRVRAAWALRQNLPTDGLPMKDLQAWLDHNADQPAGALLLGTFQSDRGQTKEAIQTLRRALDWDRQASAIWEQLAVILSNSGAPDQAIAVLREGTEVATGSATLRFMLGLAYAEQGETDRAVRELRRATRLDPNFSRAWYNLGLGLHGLGRSQEGAEALRKAAETDPGNPDPLFALATVLRDSGDLAGARDAALQLLQTAPNYPNAGALLAELEAMLNRGGSSGASGESGQGAGF